MTAALPQWWRLNRRLRRFARVGTTAAGEPADGADRHVVVADDLTREPHAGQTAFLELALFRPGHGCRFTLGELDPACRAACIPTTGVENIDACILFNREDESLS